MKKYLLIILAVVFLASITTVAFGRTIAEEKQAVRDYLNVVDAKLATAKLDNDTQKIDFLHAEKDATLTRWYKLQAEMENAQPSTEVVVIVTPAPSAEIVTINNTNTREVGRGLSLYMNGGVNAGLSGYGASLDYDLSGLPDQGIKVRMGADYILGTNPNGNDWVQVMCAKLGAVYYITPYMPDMSLPLSWYIGGDYLQPVKVNVDRENEQGLRGGEVFLGANIRMIEFGIVNFEVGYTELKYSANQPALKGMDVKIGYGLNF